MGGISFDDMGDVIAFLQLAGTALFAAMWWRATSAFASKKDVAAVGETVSAHGTRLTRLETETKNFPTSRDLHDLAKSMERLAGEIAVSNERIGGLKEDLERIENTLSRHEDILSSAAREGK